MSTMQKTSDGRGNEQNDVLGLLAEQCALCRELTGLGERQRLLIRSDKPEQLLGVLGQRQQIIDRLGVLSNRMRPYQQDWARIRSHFDQATGRRVDDMVAEVNGYLARILDGDAIDAETLANRRQATSADMGQLKVTRMAGAAYAAGQEGQRVSHVEWTDE